ncbi:MAG: hypothetical protein KDB07_05900 [Planctomycetes bacterium]|nr:hypothetical protein [Planctomycetota bacterium]
MKPSYLICLIALSLSLLSACVQSSHSTHDKGETDIIIPDATAEKLDAKIRDILENANDFELVTTEPHGKRPQDEGTKDDPRLYGYRILGRAKVSSKEQARLVNELYQGIAANKGEVAACFDPRHALVAKKGEDRVELVICFECLSMNVFLNGKRQEGVLTEGFPKKVFNEVAAKHKLKVDPGWHNNN